MKIMYVLYWQLGISQEPGGTRGLVGTEELEDGYSARNGG